MHAFVLHNLVSDYITGISDDKSEISDKSVKGMQEKYVTVSYLVAISNQDFVMRKYEVMFKSKILKPLKKLKINIIM